MAQRYKPAQATTQSPAGAFQMRVAITGGTSGLGLALVREFKARGCLVAFVARDAARVAAIAKQTGAYGITGDIGRKEDIHPVALQIAGMLGGLDVLVNNASSLGPTPLRYLGDTDCEELDLALATNLLGPFRLTKALLGALTASAREGRGGAVVLNVSSDAAINAYPGWGAYGVSKAALHQLSRIWQEELAAQNVRFLSLDPGDMDTPLHAVAVPEADPATLKRPADAARELADAIASAWRDLPTPPLRPGATSDAATVAT
jgi:NAD(P)-dependent dehydrogenase (short-subunit alcohol dehydrogenase family)